MRAVDRKPKNQWHQLHQSEGVENLVSDLSTLRGCQEATEGASRVYNLACNMGGIGFIETRKLDCMLNVLINTHLLMAAFQNDVSHYFFASSACVYNTDLQKTGGSKALTERDAYPALPEDGYGWEKLFSERMCRHFTEDVGLQTRVARFHNVYGTHGTWNGGREKAPAAICRKVARAKISGHHEIFIWGTGDQARSYMHIDDCVHGVQLIIGGPHSDPVNLGSNEVVTVNQLVDVVEEIAGVKLKRTYDLDAPQGVNYRNSDNLLMEERYAWTPSRPLRSGLEELYKWIYDEVSSGRPSR